MFEGGLGGLLISVLATMEMKSNQNEYLIQKL